MSQAFQLLVTTHFSKLQKNDIPILFSLGFFGIVIYHLALNYGEQFISAGAASLIIATIPLFVVILAILFLSEKITYNIVIGISLSLIGVIIISIYGNENIILEINYISGAIAVLIAAIAGAGYTVASLKDHLETSESIWYAWAHILGENIVPGEIYEITVTMASSSPEMLVYIMGKSDCESRIYDMAVPPTIPGFVVPEIPIGTVLSVITMLGAAGLSKLRRD